MLAWLLDLIIGNFCKHEWELVRAADLYNSTKINMPCGQRYTHICKKCCKVKHYTVR